MRYVVEVDGVGREWSLLEWALYDVDTRGAGKTWTIKNVITEPDA
jgi:hypothetical protein